MSTASGISALHDGFNSNFYIVTATVIPVFYLALVLQFSIIAGIIKAAARNAHALGSSAGRKIGLVRRTVRWALVLTTFYAAFGVALLVLVAGANGEIVSVLALYHQSGSRLDEIGALRAAIILPIAALLVPVWTIIVEIARFALSAIPDRAQERFLIFWRKTWDGTLEPEPVSVVKDEVS